MVAGTPIDITKLIEALTRPDAYLHPVDAIEVHQTHISVVFLAGPYAYKIKKPVNLGFLDFSTLEKRKHYCEEEVRLNRRLASHVYLGVVPITGSYAQASRSPPLLVGRPGTAVEWAVQMKRLPADATLESRLERGEVTSEQIRAIAQRLAAFHRAADAGERISSFGRFAKVAQNARENFTQAKPLIGTTVSPAVFERVRALTEAQLAQRRDLMEARAERGTPRDTHGDLHLDHVYLFPHEAPPNDLVMIDCIEFSDRYRYADPVADLAFLAMDLEFHGRRDLARLCADAYFDASGDPDGRELMPFYAAYRAIVRAKVEGMELSEKEIDAAERRQAAARARGHWLLALGHLEEPANRPSLLLIAGLPGSGKSTLAHAVATAANFEVLRSDVVRKELTAGTSENIYTDAWTERTYGELLTRAEKLFWQGCRVIIDANFREDHWRRRFLEAARRWCVPILFVHCHADPDVIKQRLAARKHDVSDADWGIYQMLQSSWQPLSDEVRRVGVSIETSSTLTLSQQTVLSRLSVEALL